MEECFACYLKGCIRFASGTISTLTIIMPCQVFPTINNFFMCFILEGFPLVILYYHLQLSKSFASQLTFFSPSILLHNCKSNKPQTSITLSQVQKYKSILGEENKIYILSLSSSITATYLASKKTKRLTSTLNSN